MCGLHAREGVLAEEVVAVYGLARAEDSLVAAQVKVPLDRARQDYVDNMFLAAGATFGDGSVGERDEFCALC